MSFFERLQQLLSENGISQRKLISDLKIGAGTISTWKTRGTIPNGEVLMQIAEYFKCSVDYLLGKSNEKEKPAVVSDPDEAKMRKLYAAYSALSPERQHQLDDYIAFLLSQRGE